jgi:microcystin-dependent protein
MATPFLGELKLISFNFAPKGWAFCNGQLLPINQNQALFSLLGTTYGGDGRVNFALPDLRGRRAAHREPSFHPLGERTGADVHTLTAQELPTHTHTLRASRSDADQPSPTGALLAGANNAYAPANALTTLQPTSITNVGGSQPHENRPPYLVLGWIIALQGIFPSQN